MANLYKVSVTHNSAKEVSVVAETPEEAQSKVQLVEGDTVTAVTEVGEVVL